AHRRWLARRRSPGLARGTRRRRPRQRPYRPASTPRHPPPRALARDPRTILGGRHAENGVEAHSALTQVSAHLPETPEGGTKVQSQNSIAARHRPVERGSNIVLVQLEAVQPFLLLGSEQLWRHLLRQGQI